MKCVILAGGKGTRISEESQYKPKPLIEIGGVPIIVHIMRHYAKYGVKDFLICLGHLGGQIIAYFEEHAIHFNHWNLTFLHTGENTGTAGRLKQIRDRLKHDRFFLTYGDGLSDVNIRDLLEFHVGHRCVATVTAVQPPGRFGALKIDEDRVTTFNEKPKGDSGWVSGGFFVFEPGMMEYLYGEGEDIEALEASPLMKMATSDNLMAFKHHGFWQPMDSMRDKEILEELWKTGAAPWK